MTTVDADLLARLPLPRIAKVTFYKRDEITTDLICCDVDVDGNVWTFHEELIGWDLLIGHLQRLPGFRTEWFGLVSQPSFGAGDTVAFERY